MSRHADLKAAISVSLQKKKPAAATPAKKGMPPAKATAKNSAPPPPSVRAAPVSAPLTSLAPQTPPIPNFAAP